MNKRGNNPVTFLERGLSFSIGLYFYVDGHSRIAEILAEQSTLKFIFLVIEVFCHASFC